MPIEQQVIYCRSGAEQIEKHLNRLGQEGWRFQDVSTMVIHKGGAAFVMRSAYWQDDHFFVMSKTPDRWQYRCRYLSRQAGPDQDLAAINAEIQAQNREGFVLTRILHLTAIGDNPERPTKGTIAHLCLFEAPFDDQ